MRHPWTAIVFVLFFRAAVEVPAQESTDKAPPEMKIEDDKMQLKVERFEITGNKAFTVDQLFNVIQGTRGKVGYVLSLAEVKGEAEMIALYYRHKGYPQARAYLPVQEFKGGVVRIAVVEGLFDESGTYRSCRLWDAAAGKELPVGVGDKGRGLSVALSPDGNMLASGGWENNVSLWDTATGKKLREIGGFQGLVYSVAFSPDGKTLASGSRDGTIRLWDPAAGRELVKMERRDGGVNCVVFSRDGKMLASGHSQSRGR